MPLLHGGDHAGHGELTRMARHTLADWWPPARIRIRSPRLELRLATEAELLDVVDLIHDGIYEPHQMPFASAWAEDTPKNVAKGALAWHWSQRAAIEPHSWRLLLTVFLDGEVIGAQDVSADNFGKLRRVDTGSWLGQRFQGSGYGTEMREAVLAFAFEGLRALTAHSGAHADNPASQRVSEKCGYERNGRTPTWVERGPTAPPGAVDYRTEMLEYRIDADTWAARANRPDIELSGINHELLACLGAT